MWLFFRDDDLGWNAKEFSRLLTLFARHDQRLNAAAIPSLLTDEVLKESIPYSYQASPYLQIVTHGFAHENHNTEGKKSEFGPARESSEVREQLLRGRLDLESRLENYFPCFVPPWNRFDEKFLGLLPECGYKMLSRDERSANTKATIPEFGIGLDLHTQKNETKLTAKEIFRELARFNDEGRDFAGIMLHHARMEENDFLVLDELLKELTKRNIQSVFFSDMLPGSERRTGIEVGHV